MTTLTVQWESREATQRFGKRMGESLQPGDVVALIGDLGTGKTTLTQGIAQGLGIQQQVTSPTFTLVQEYEGRIPLFHCDPYRLESAEDLLGFGFEEYFERGAAVVVEWADRVLAALPEDILVLQITFAASAETPLDSGSLPRTCRITSYGTRSEALLRALKEGDTT